MNNQYDGEDWEMLRATDEESPTASPNSFRNRITADEAEEMPNRIIRITRDLEDLNKFYNIQFSARRKARLRSYLSGELRRLQKAPFDDYDQSGKIDYLLLRNLLEKYLQKLKLDDAQDEKMVPLLPFASTIIRLCEDRQSMKPIQAKNAAQVMHDLGDEIKKTEIQVKSDKIQTGKSTAFRAAKSVDSLRSQLTEWFNFFNLYDPLFTWWVEEPFGKVTEQLKSFSKTILEKLVGIRSDDADAIVGEPIGHDGLTAELEAEKIAYTPEELIRIADIEYDWCEKEMIKASHALGFGEDWRGALEHVKNLYVEPGQQPQLIRNLAAEATNYVQEHDLVTVPQLSSETWRMFMMAPERQKVSPFFLGGASILVSYPTNTMDHEFKLMSMRGNNIHFSRSTVFHELIPGHRLQLFMSARHRPYRGIFATPFYIEGWAFYWEMVLWDDDRFLKSPENRIGMLFWRMHRCARILFSIKFHLGQMTPQECIDLLVNMVGHERSNAEGEVRRSFAGQYPPLYQVAYMLGALQFYSLRKELVDGGIIQEKIFHDRILRENGMPVEFLRALFKNQLLTRNFKPSWRFYDDNKL